MHLNPFKLQRTWPMLMGRDCKAKVAEGVEEGDGGGKSRQAHWHNSEPDDQIQRSLGWFTFICKMKTRILNLCDILNHTCAGGKSKGCWPGREDIGGRALPGRPPPPAPPDGPAIPCKKCVHCLKQFPLVKCSA
jgi:hypothetical protein